MWILPLVGYLGLGLGFGFLTLAIGKFPWVIRSTYKHVLMVIVSIWTILPFRTRRRAYRYREETPYEADLYRHWCSSPPLPDRWFPVFPLHPKHLFACCLPGEYATVSYCQAVRSVVHKLMRYTTIASQSESTS